MTQIATVERIINSQYAEISVPRKSACGHDCEECAGCGVTGAAVHAKAANPIDARPGQKVVVQSDTQKMLRIWRLLGNAQILQIGVAGGQILREEGADN